MDHNSISSISRDQQYLLLKKESTELRISNEKYKSLFDAIRDRPYVRRMYGYILSRRPSVVWTEIDPYQFDRVRPQRGDTRTLIELLNESGCDVDPSDRDYDKDDNRDEHLTVYWGDDPSYPSHEYWSYLRKSR